MPRDVKDTRIAARPEKDVYKRQLHNWAVGRDVRPSQRAAQS